MNRSEFKSKVKAFRGSKLGSSKTITGSRIIEQVSKLKYVKRSQPYRRRMVYVSNMKVQLH
jgi:hypothetical protein